MPNSLNPNFLLNSQVRGILVVSIIGILSSALTGCSGTMIHNDLKEDHRIMTRKWTFSTHGPLDMGDRGTEYSNPVVVDNTLVFGNRTQGLISLYPSINQKRWVVPIQGGVVSELTIDHGSIYFGGGDGFMYSVNAEDGKINWKYEVRNPVISRPTVSNNRVFITTSNDVVYAFDAGTGKWLWHYRRASLQNSTIYGASSPLVDGNRVITGLSDGFLIALSVDEGQLKWEKKLHNAPKFTDVDAHPVIENGIIYVPSYDGALYALKKLPDGSGVDILWKFDAGGSKDVVIDDQRLFLPSSDGNVYALHKSSGKLLWKFQLDQGVPTQLVVTDKLVIFGSTYRYLYAVEKNPDLAEGSEVVQAKGLYRFDVGQGSGFAGSPAFDSVRQRLYILSGGGNLYSFALRQPQRKLRPHGMTDPYEFIISWFKFEEFAWPKV